MEELRMRKKQLLMTSLSMMLVMVLAVGAGTYALFTSTDVNQNNVFKSGTLELSSHRHDVPISGPMFYTNAGDNEGWMETGLWAPKDRHTRAMLIKNTGSLEGKLDEVIAIPESDPVMARTFGEQAYVTIAVLDGPFSDWTPEAIRLLNVAQDNAYAEGMSFWLTQPATRTFADLAAAVREALQREIFNSGIIVKDVFVGQLDELMDGSSAFNEVLIAPDQTIYMGYTVDFLDHTNNNAVQGQEIKFTFKSTFVQTANNP